MKDRYRTGIRIEDARGALREVISPLGAGDDFNRFHILPGFTDVHVHLREPGFSYKGTIRTETKAAAAGGFTHVISMPNLDPVPDSIKNLKVQRDLIDKSAEIFVHPLGSITRGEKGQTISDIEELAPLVPGFSDDGAGVMDDGLMREAMERIAESGSMVVAHCEDVRFPRESREAEYRQLERDLKLVEMTGCPYHMCHMSTSESVDLIREAKRGGLDVSCETAPHYLALSDEDVRDEGRFKMNPPIKSKTDQLALIEALQDGTIDMVATDHAPHSAAEKSGGFAASAYGIVGSETAFPVLYTRLVRSGIIGIEKLLELLVYKPNERFGIESAMPGEAEQSNTFALWDLEEPYRIDPLGFCSKGNSTPFAGWEVYGRCMMTVIDGEVVFRR